MSFAYINTATGEYPRHAGDIAKDREAPWEIVEQTELPELSERQYVTEGAPVKDGKGVYRQTWIVTTLTESEWEQRRLENAKARLASFGLTIQDLKTLLAEEA